MEKTQPEAEKRQALVREALRLLEKAYPNQPEGGYYVLIGVEFDGEDEMKRLITRAPFEFVVEMLGRVIGHEKPTTMTGPILEEN